MKPLAIGIDPTAVLVASARYDKRSASQSPFDFLLNRLASNATNQTTDTTSATSTSTDTTAQTDPLSSSNTPASLFEETIKASNIPVDRLSVSADDRSRLEGLLSMSGYRDEDVRQILDQSKNSDGSINLGAMFTLMHKYVPQDAPQFSLKVEDKPLLIQVLKGLGVAEDDISKFMDGLEVKGDRLVVKGLPSLLAKSGSQNQGQDVDKSVLTDLLTRLGLSQNEASTLLAKATDNQDRTNAQAVLAMLQQAANRQDGTVASYLKDLAQRTKVSGGAGTKPGDAERIKAQFIQLYEQIEARVKSEGEGVHEALAFVLKNEGKDGEKATESSSRLLKAELGQVAGRLVDSTQATTGSGQTQGQTQGQAQGQTQGQTQGQAQGQGQSASSDALGRLRAASAQVQTSTAEGAGGAGQSASRLSGDLPQAALRSTLPTYVVRQVGQQMVQMVAKQQTSLQLALKPPSLGEINLEISVKDGVVKATMVAESVAAKQALEAGMDQLKQQMAAQGLKLGQVDIVVNPDAQREQSLAQDQTQNQFAGGGGSGGQGSSTGGGWAGESEDDSGSLLAAFAGQTSGRISVFA